MVAKKSGLHMGKDKGFYSYRLMAQDATSPFQVLTLNSIYCPMDVSGCSEHFTSEPNYYENAAIRFSEKKPDSGVYLCPGRCKNGRKVNKMFTEID